MSNLINDGSLVGLWPLNEPSGAPFFKNYSPAYGKHPSGLSFDFHVHVADVANNEEMMSRWPGRDTVFDSASGISLGNQAANRTGLRLEGIWSTNANQSSPNSRYLLMGAGAKPQQEQCLTPRVAGSGFTAGIWIYPNSDGLTEPSEINTAGFGWNQSTMRMHTIYSLADIDEGWRIGVSGQRRFGAQLEGSNPDGLRAYVGLEDTSAAAIELHTVPIESGKFTHVTISYEYVDGVSNVIKLYKDGVLEVNETTNKDITLANNGIVTRPLSIGASAEGVVNTFDYPLTAGWGNLASGAYLFRRVLSDAEVSEIHGCGGLQPEEAHISETKEITIDDPLLLAYYPFTEPGYADVSQYHRPLIGNEDLGDLTIGGLPTPGPYGFGGGIVTIANASHVMAANSGLCYDIAGRRSWTIGGWFAPENSAERDDNMMLSWGSVSTITVATQYPTQGTVTTNSAGLVVSVSGLPDPGHQVIAEFYGRGDIDAINNEVLRADSTLEHYDYGAMHIAVSYDDQTKGVALYVNGLQQASGTLAHSLSEQLERISGSGFPLMFGNGITNQPVDSALRGVHAAGGSDMWFGPLFVYGRAMLPSEVRAVAASGVNFNRLWRTHHDPRLMGYWPATDFKLGDVLVEDRARVWNELPGHLTRSDTFAKQERWYDRDQNEAAGTIFNELGVSRYNQFGANRTLPAELASEGNLGITSGVFSVLGGSMGTMGVADADNARSSIGNLGMRYKPCFEQFDASPQNILGEYIISYEVTPSGDIPMTLLGTTANTLKQQFNSVCHVHGNLGAGTADGEVRSFITAINTGIPGSGLAVKFVCRDGTFNASNTIPLVSGEVPYGVPSRVLLHGKFGNPYDLQGITGATTHYSVSLYINGTKVQERALTPTTAKVWSNGTPNSTVDDWLLHFGGEPFADTITTQLTGLDSGLGEMYMRNMFVMRGLFGKDEVEALATSGIQSVSVTGFSNQPTKTQVDLGNSALQAYYRFNGFDGGPTHGVQGSGTKDLSANSNHLFPFAEIKAQRGVDTTAAFHLRAVPGPLEESDLGVRASGFTYSSVLQVAANEGYIAPFMASGTGFNTPNTGFSVGFFAIKKGPVGNAQFNTMVAYGPLGTASVSDTTFNENRGWVIGMDDTEAMKMVISTGGALYLDNVANAVQSGQVTCGAFGTANGVLEDLRQFDQYKLGAINSPHLDSWNHWCWVYDPTAFEVKCYLNGEVVDRKGMKAETNKWSGPQVPASLDARYLTFYQHTNDLWDFNVPNLLDRESAMTDFFYFNDALTDAEVRYIAQNGIDDVVTTRASGVPGGYVHGLDTGSGVVGMYQQGQDVGSGLLASYMFAAERSSGIIGGYISGVTFGDGLTGGFMLGGISASGLIGGYMFSADQTSGIVGGFILGGFNGLVEFDGNYTVEVMTAQDFDAQLHVLQTNSTDFDAKLVIFQDEIGPLVDIETPSTTVEGLAPPFNQYFVGKASGQQGKTITQTKWTFGDLTPTVSVAESGNGCYPVQHNFASSGFYIVKFEAIDSDGQHGAATRIVNAASGIDPVILSLSGVPRSGSAALTIDFDTTYDIIPANTAIIASLLDFDDGQKTTLLNPTHVYTEPGVYKPIWCVRDSRGVIWCDSLEAGNDLLES